MRPLQAQRSAHPAFTEPHSTSPLATRDASSESSLAPCCSILMLIVLFSTLCVFKCRG